MSAVEKFDGSRLRLARLFHAFTLEDVALRVKPTRQYLHKLETGQATPTEELAAELARALDVMPGFFAPVAGIALNEDQCHFRKLSATRSQVRQSFIATAEVFRQFVSLLEARVKLPAVSIPTRDALASAADIEQAAENCRRAWGLGLGPISSMVRVVERAGVLVTTFSDLSKQVDALSISSSRPIIVYNESKGSGCRLRFDLAHELGHLVLHEGQITGDRVTEGEANHFAGAFLLPRSTMMAAFPKPRFGRLDWAGLRDFKLQWKVSKAAILYRARQLELIDENQYRTGFITLKRSGEAIEEKEDHLIAVEQPELIYSALSALYKTEESAVSAVATQMQVGAGFVRRLFMNWRGEPTPRTLGAEPINMFAWRAGKSLIPS